MAHGDIPRQAEHVGRQLFIDQAVFHLHVFQVLVQNLLRFFIARMDAAAGIVQQLLPFHRRDDGARRILAVHFFPGPHVDADIQAGRQGHHGGKPLHRVFPGFAEPQRHVQLFGPIQPGLELLSRKMQRIKSSSMGRKPRSFAKSSWRSRSFLSRLFSGMALTSTICYPYAPSLFLHEIRFILLTVKRHLLLNYRRYQEEVNE